MKSELKQIQDLIYDILDKGTREDKQELLKLLEHELTIVRGVLK